MPKEVSDEDKALFREAVKAVKPLKKSNMIEQDLVVKAQRSHQKAATQTTIVNKPTLNQSTIFLSNYYTHEVQAQSTLSFCRSNIPAKRLRELKQGKIPWQSKLDLHGFQIEAAQDSLVTFILQEIALNHRCILIVHGKGSQNGEPPVLKNLVNHWLPQVPSVIAFHSALPRDGGSGALYVLLKRNR
ncbi:Smr domain protein, DNA mismatch repair protein-like protein [Legionella beliardensis]|uniref:Smr domain protein, DNA mismatch repair protein-like protein n=1 Tax=Legionella beliardensis TaxID=91822 RepID=A0A378I4G0_9GAMM|nr:Smr/MutS family protein [Legionella beliardensis]STX29630.1 Smr domain protein, DNA mismatch repair protein-like protein [Legionella beliardensis]